MQQSRKAKNGFCLSLAMIVILCLGIANGCATIPTASVTISPSATLMPAAASPTVPPSATGSTILALPSLPPLPTATEALEPRPVKPPEERVNGRLLFLSNVADYPTIYTVNPDGTNLRLIFDDRAMIFSPRWTLDGNFIVFDGISPDNRFSDLFLLSFENSEISNLTNSTNDERSPAISPDGSRIVYTISQEEGGTNDLVLRNMHGTDPISILGYEGTLGHLAWSPDGSYIVFYLSSRQSGLPGIYRIKPDGSSFVRLTADNVAANEPTWSVDGKHIAFTVDFEDQSDIFVMEADGSNTRNLTNSPGYQFSSAWSPDGKWIAFASLQPDHLTAIEVIDVNGGDRKTLTVVNGSAYALDWGSTPPDLSPTATPTPVLTPAPESPEDWLAAEEILVAFFSHLHRQEYEQAARLYGGKYGVLIDNNPSLYPHDHPSLLQHACEANGYNCLLIKKVQKKEVVGNEFKFLVEFQLDDGSLFVRGPCCGASIEDQPPVSQFTYTVLRTPSGDFLVMELPVYTP